VYAAAFSACSPGLPLPRRVLLHDNAPNLKLRVRLKDLGLQPLQ
jgi:hypothetical protein